MPAAAADPVRFALCYDLSKVYTFVTPQVAQAARDYADLLNVKGGIEGHPIEMVVQDHGNEPQRGIECYEKLKREGVMVFDMLSTPVSRAVLPRVMKDGNILIQSLAGRGDAVDGDVFKWVFPIGPTYWGQVANDVEYIKQKSGGNLKGVKVAFLYVDYPFGQEPIGILKTLAEKEGFDLQLFPYPLPGNDQASAWTQIRRYNPDWIISWSLSNMHVIASREMKRNGIPIDKYISVNWLNEVDIKNIGAGGRQGSQARHQRRRRIKSAADPGNRQGTLRQGQRQRRPQEPRGRLLQHRPGDLVDRGRRRPPGDQEGRLATDAAEDQGRSREHEGLRRQRHDGAGYRHGAGSRRRRQNPHRDVGRRQMGAANRLDRGLQGRRLERREGAIGRLSPSPSRKNKWSAAGQRHGAVRPDR